MEDEPLIVRVGTFFLVLGWGSFILFVASDFAKEPDFNYLFIAMILIAIGWGFRSKKAPPPSAGRFSLFRKKPKSDNSKQEKK